MDVCAAAEAVPATVFARPRVRTRGLIALFALTLFLGAALIFLVEPMFAKMILPLLGGSPAVWNTCVVFFQTGLLAGYAYAHVLTTRLSVRQQAVTHGAVVLLAAAALPVGLRSGWTPPVDGTPIPWLLLMLTLGLGAPFLVVSATAPLLQKWFAGTDHPSAQDPYYLYSASNVGSILALLAYPFLVEPSWSLSTQSATWSAGYAIFAAMTLGCAVIAARHHVAGGPGVQASAVDPSAEAGSHGEAASVTWGQRAYWLSLSAVPSSLLLGVTTYLSTDIAAVPLLWTVPLTLYLLSFVLAFAPARALPARLADRAMPLLVAVLALTIGTGTNRILVLLMPLHLVTFFACALYLHTALAERRPGTRHLTEFYLWMAAGGVVGGMFNTFIAPLAFTGVIEYPLAIAAACLVRPWPVDTTVRRLTRADAALPLALGAVTLAVAFAQREQVLTVPVFIGLLTLLTIWCYSFSRRPVRFGLGIAMMLLATQLVPRDGHTLVAADRTFFGVLRVRADAAADRHILMHGSTVHGEQSTRADKRDEPLTYYHRSGPIGQTMDALAARLRTAHIGVVGLGAGSMAAYAMPGQRWTFYEIDPAVARIARDAGMFTYLSKCGDACRVVLGDARLSLARAQADAYSLLVLDAFSSDGIPVHLVTSEALDLYLSRLVPDGIIAFHISNRHLDIAPILAALAEQHGLVALLQRDGSSTAERAEGRYASEWLLMARSRDAFGPMASDSRWIPATAAPGTRVWTDDFSDVLAVLKTNWAG
jgi:hypothetical protein